MSVAFQQRRGGKAKYKRRQEILKERQTPGWGRDERLFAKQVRQTQRRMRKTRKTKRKALRQVKSKVVVVVAGAALLAAVMG